MLQCSGRYDTPKGLFVTLVLAFMPIFAVQFKNLLNMKLLSRLSSNGTFNGRDVVRWLAVAVFLLATMTMPAQTVSVSPKTGNVISAASYSEESHLTGFGGAWVHNQLPMTLVSSDESTLTDNGLMSKHANNIGMTDDKTALVVTSGYAPRVNNHMSLSLPKGYRFTSYKMVLAYNSGPSCTFREMNAAFSKANQTPIRDKSFVYNSQ